MPKWVRYSWKRCEDWIVWGWMAFTFCCASCCLSLWSLLYALSLLVAYRCLLLSALIAIISFDVLAVSGRLVPWAIAVHNCLDRRSVLRVERSVARNSDFESLGWKNEASLMRSTATFAEEGGCSWKVRFDKEQVFNFFSSVFLFLLNFTRRTPFFQIRSSRHAHFNHQETWTPATLVWLSIFALLAKIQWRSLGASACFAWSLQSRAISTRGTSVF